MLNTDWDMVVTCPPFVIDRSSLRRVWWALSLVKILIVLLPLVSVYKLRKLANWCLDSNNRWLPAATYYWLVKLLIFNFVVWLDCSSLGLDLCPSLFEVPKKVLVHCCWRIGRGINVLSWIYRVNRCILASLSYELRILFITMLKIWSNLIDILLSLGCWSGTNIVCWASGFPYKVDTIVWHIMTTWYLLLLVSALLFLRSPYPLKLSGLLSGKLDLIDTFIDWILLLLYTLIEVICPFCHFFDVLTGIQPGQSLFSYKLWILLRTHLILLWVHMLGMSVLKLTVNTAYTACTWLSKKLGWAPMIQIRRYFIQLWGCLMRLDFLEPCLSEMVSNCGIGSNRPSLACLSFAFYYRFQKLSCEHAVCRNRAWTIRWLFLRDGVDLPHLVVSVVLLHVSKLTCSKIWNHSSRDCCSLQIWHVAIITALLDIRHHTLPHECRLLLRRPGMIKKIRGVSTLVSSSLGR